jgi:F420-0:gamma-glutamyl ligase
MKIIQIKTRKILPPKDNLEELLSFVPKLDENSVVAISSKVISICEGSTKAIWDPYKKTDRQSFLSY